jgi:branched-chain amino acid transport system ATP-binding protein
MNAATMSERAALAPAPPVLLAAEAVGVSYGRVRALESLSFGIHGGGTVLVLGLNGAGKSTLMRALAGVVPLRSGMVTLAGRDISTMPAHRRVRHGISLVPEGRGVLPGLSVRENLELGWHAAPRSRRGGLDEAVGRMLALFPTLGGRLRQDCQTLSGGQMQMLAIAGRCCPGPPSCCSTNRRLALRLSSRQTSMRRSPALAAKGWRR